MSILDVDRPPRLPWLWDYDLDEATFTSLLNGDGDDVVPPLDRDWAAVRLIEYAPWIDIVRRIGWPALVADWPRWRDRVRSESRRRGIDFAVEWVRANRPDLAA